MKIKFTHLTTAAAVALAVPAVAQAAGGDATHQQDDNTNKWGLLGLLGLAGLLGLKKRDDDRRDRQ